MNSNNALSNYFLNLILLVNAMGMVFVIRTVNANAFLDIMIKIVVFKQLI